MRPSRLKADADISQRVTSTLLARAVRITDFVVGLWTGGGRLSRERPRVPELAPAAAAGGGILRFLPGLDPIDDVIDDA